MTTDATLSCLRLAADRSRGGISWSGSVSIWPRGTTSEITEITEKISRFCSVLSVSSVVDFKLNQRYIFETRTGH